MTRTQGQQSRAVEEEEVRKGGALLCDKRASAGVEIHTVLVRPGAKLEVAEVRMTLRFPQEE